MSAPELSGPAESSAYRIADLELDVGQARVTRAGHEIPLPKLSFDLLLALVEAAPRLLTLDDLMQRVWRGVIVSPETISQRVKLLRDALGDDAAQPRYVASVRGRGYRLVASVEALRPASPAPASHEPTPMAGPVTAAAPVDAAPAVDGVIRRTVAPTRGWWSRTAWLALAAAVAGGVLWALRDSPVTTHKPPPAAEAPAPATPRAVAVLPFTDLSGTQAGSTLALGIAETLRHQLAGLKEIDVIGQSSSTAMRGADLDLREVGRKLHARYLLGGSVQSGALRLRVTAQLVDATTGLQVWSLRFDRAPEDVFAMEDEIAVAVTKALALSVDADARGRLTKQGTTDFEAYLAFLQGRALLGSGSVREARLAIDQFKRAIDKDSEFATAYVALAEAQAFAAEYDPAMDSRTFAGVLHQAEVLIEQALVIDPILGAAFLQRGYLRAFTDLQAAEADLRRGLELSPSDARGYARLASIVFVDRKRGTEALALLDRARRLEPLEPEYDVTKAVYQLYARGDVAAADDQLMDVLRREPLYPPALGRLAEVRFCCQGRLADAVQLGQQALSLDPLAEWTRHIVIRSAVGMGLPQAGRDAARTAPEQSEVGNVALLLGDGHVHEAAEVGYRAIESDSLLELDEPLVVSSIREEARRTHDYARAIAALTKSSGLTWDEQGAPRLRARFGSKFKVVALADVMMLAGQTPQARRLVDALLADIKLEEDLGRSARWYVWTTPQALMLLGRRAEALSNLEREDLLPARISDGWYFLQRDPILTGLRDEPRFQKIAAEVTRRERWERERYIAMHPPEDQAAAQQAP